MLITRNVLDATWTSLNARYQAGIDDRGTETWYQAIADRIQSTTRTNSYAWMSGFPGMREWLGDRVFNSLSMRRFELTNRDWEDSIEVDRNDIEDEQMGIYGNIAQGLGRQARKWPDELVVAALKAGTTTTTFDGQFFFDTDHPTNPDVAGSATQSNSFTGRALTDANIDFARVTMAALKGDNGRLFGTRMTHVIVGPADERAARNIAQGDVVASGGIAVTNVLRGTFQIIVIPELADQPGVWYAADLSQVIKPFIFQVRKEPEFVAMDNPDDMPAFVRKKFLYGVDARGVAGYGPWWLIARFAP